MQKVRFTLSNNYRNVADALATLLTHKDREIARLKHTLQEERDRSQFNWPPVRHRQPETKQPSSQGIKPS